MMTDDMTWIVLAVILVAAVAVCLCYWHRDRNHQPCKEIQEDEPNKERVTVTAFAKERAARQVAERALLLKRQMTDNLSREIISSVNAILGFSEMLALTGDDEDGRYLADHVLDNSRRLSAMVGRIAELSHYELLERVDRRGKVLVNLTCQQLLSGYEHQVAKGVELQFETSLPDDCIIHTNEECLEKILRHLVGNAVRHTSEGVISLSVTDGGGREKITFSVTDTGAGIPEKYRKTVFEELPEMGYDLKITGLGLMIARVLVRLLGGVIYIDPSRQKGTRVVFDISTL